MSVNSEISIENAGLDLRPRTLSNINYHETYEWTAWSQFTFLQNENPFHNLLLELGVTVGRTPREQRGEEAHNFLISIENYFRNLEYALSGFIEWRESYANNENSLNEFWEIYDRVNRGEAYSWDDEIELLDNISTTVNNMRHNLDEILVFIWYNIWNYDYRGFDDFCVLIRDYCF